jgi:heme/copper-type cytochrome/quinol oxidase subunit 3
MSDHKKPIDHSAEMTLSEELGFEARDLDVGITSKVGMWFFLFVGLMLFLAWVSMAAIRQLEGPSRAEQPFVRVPAEPYPILQSNATAWQDMKDLRQKEREGLKAEGEQPALQIPVEEAIAELSRGGGR